MSTADPAQAAVVAPPAENTQNIIIAPQPTPHAKTQPVEDKPLDPCCGLPSVLGCFGAALAFFIIFITIAGVLGKGQDTFCNGYWRASPAYQLGKHSAVAVWAFLEGCTFFWIGLLLILENVAASKRMLGTRDMLRTLLLWSVLFFIAWTICGNVWIIGAEGHFGVVPQACKDGNMGNRNLYHFCLAILIFLDIAIPLSLLAIALLTRDSRGVPFNKTLMAGNAASQPTLSEEEQREDPNARACCSPSLAGSCCGLGLIFFIVFITTTTVLGQTQTAFCDGYWMTSPGYQLGSHSAVAVWAWLQGSALLFLCFLWLVENRAAAARAWAMRDAVRTMILLTALFNVGWLICGNTWILGPESAFGVVPQACKDGNMGNRNLYHFCEAMIIFLDIAFPIAMIAAFLSTLDTQRYHVLNKPLGYTPPNTGALPPADQKAVAASHSWLPACCSLPVSLINFFCFCIPLFVLFVTIPSVLEPGTMALPWDQTFCNRYWQDPVTYPGAMIAGHSTIAVWSLLMGACFFFIGLLWFLENRAAAMGARGCRDVLRTLILLTALFMVSWMITGNIWIINDQYNFGVVPQDCKSGLMGNRNLYHFVYAMIIFLDIMVPLALFAVWIRTGLNKTLACCDTPPPPPVKEEPVVVEKPAPSLLIGQA